MFAVRIGYTQWIQVSKLHRQWQVGEYVFVKAETGDKRSVILKFDPRINYWTALLIPVRSNDPFIPARNAPETLPNAPAPLTLLDAPDVSRGSLCGS